MSERSSVHRGDDDNTMLHVVYGLYALSYLTGFTLFIGVILAYVQRGNDLSANQHDHIDWQIRTFWWSLLFGLLILTTPFILGFLLGGILIALATIWFAYRLIKGWYYLYQGRVLDNPHAFL